MASKKDLEQFGIIRERVELMVENDSARTSLYDDMRDMFMMQWDGGPTASWVKKIVSPDAYDTVIGILRLLMAAEPQISIPQPGETETMGRDEQMERALRALLHRADAIRDISSVYDAMFSAILFGEICMRVGNTDDLLSILPNNSVLATQAARVPYTFETLNPATVFTESDIMGLRRVAICKETTVGAVRDLWGKKASMLVDRDDTEVVELRDYWDRTYRAVWIHEATQAILVGKHKLPFLPVVRRVVQGTGLWSGSTGVYDVWPLLFPMKQSGMWDAQNTAFTMINSLARAMGSVPFTALIKDDMNQPDPEIDWEHPGINMRMPSSMKLERVATGAIPPDMVALLNLVEGKVPEMLMPKVVFGQAPGGNMAFSAINLLSQGGRMPIVPIQERVGDALAAVLEIVMRWVKLEGKERQVYDRGALSKIDPKDINLDSVYIEVTITPNIPQDRMQIGTMVSQLEARGIISKKRAREWLHILDDMAETEQVIMEAYIQMQVEEFARQAGEVSDVEEHLPGRPEPPPDLEAPTKGPLFDLSQGGIPGVMTRGTPQQIVPTAPGPGPASVMPVPSEIPGG